MLIKFKRIKCRICNNAELDLSSLTDRELRGKLSGDWVCKECNLLFNNKEGGWIENELAIIMTVLGMLFLGYSTVHMEDSVIPPKVKLTTIYCLNTPFAEEGMKVKDLIIGNNSISFTDVNNSKITLVNTSCVIKEDIK